MQTTPQVHSHRRLSNLPTVFLVLSLSIFLLSAWVFDKEHRTHPAPVSEFGWQNTFDMTVESHLNRLVNRWPQFDLLASLFAEHNLLKGAPIVFLCWAAFFEKQPTKIDLTEGRAKLASVIPLAIVAVLIGRTLAKVLPFRERPFRDAALHFQLPHGMSPGDLYSWSSFPSDHLILFMALAIGVFFASRRLGILALCYVIVAIAGPRLYLGIHWPTDVLAGALIGLAFASVATLPVYRNFVWRWATKWWDSYPGLVAGALFLLSYEITELFDAPISIASHLLKHRF